jgi:uncharacterized DUF497 family protein
MMAHGDLLFEWDGAKALANFEKHGLRFEAASDVFLDPDHVEVDASREADGEARRKAFGTVDGQFIAVVYVVRGDVVRLISARPARQKEVRHGDRTVQARPQ